MSFWLYWLKTLDGSNIAVLTNNATQRHNHTLMLDGLASRHMNLNCAVDLLLAFKHRASDGGGSLAVVYILRLAAIDGSYLEVNVGRRPPK